MLEKIILSQLNCLNKDTLVYNCVGIGTNFYGCNIMISGVFRTVVEFITHYNYYSLNIPIHLEFNVYDI